MIYYLSEDAVLKRLETPSVYLISTDELYELDEESFTFLVKASSPAGVSSGRNDFVDYCLSECLLTEVPTVLRRATTNASPVPSLRYLELQITDRCNLRCRHCYIGDAEGKDLPVSTLRSVLREFEEMQGLRLLITGGEPLLHREFGLFNDMLLSYGLRKVLFTNGLLLTDEAIRGLHVDEVQVSIDGLRAAHDRIRGEGSFERAMAAVRRCIDAGVDVSIATMVTAWNLQDFPSMDRLFREIGVKDWTVDVPCMSERMTGSPELMVSPGEGGRFLRYGFGGGYHGGIEGYACGLHLGSVSADGRISRCTFYADRPAGYVNEGLRRCWERIVPVRLAELRCDCSHIEECRGGCRYRAELLEGPLGRDLYKCGMHDIMG